MKSNELTSKEKEILDFIKNKVTKKGFPPSIREICKGVNLKSTSSVHNYLCSLESKGYIRRYPETPRAIEVIEKKDNKLNNKLKCVPCMPSVCINWPPLDVDIKNYGVSQ